jgi:hypothetical protein
LLPVSRTVSEGYAHPIKRLLACRHTLKEDRPSELVDPNAAHSLERTETIAAIRGDRFSTPSRAGRKEFA